MTKKIIGGFILFCWCLGCVIVPTFGWKPYLITVISLSVITFLCYLASDEKNNEKEEVSEEWEIVSEEENNSSEEDWEEELNK